jgi:hypothetical protein
MKPGILRLSVLAALLAVTACQGDVSRPSSVNPASGQATLDAFVGSWSGSTVAPSSDAPAGCSQVDYTVTKVSDTTAKVSFKGSCAGVTADGSGNGTLSGSTLSWDAQGTVASGGQPACPFSFRNSTATKEGENLRITYNGTICGLPVSGSQVVSRK